MKVPISLMLNGHQTTLDVEPFWTLQRLLRDELETAASVP
jgi:aerobic-type carbon monoxide dehydrogenase small subunit (CoxS/CutS family)